MVSSTVGKRDFYFPIVKENDEWGKTPQFEINCLKKFNET